MEGYKKYTGLTSKEWRKPRNKNFVNACSPSTVQALYSLTCSKHIHGTYRPTDTTVASAASASWIWRQTSRMKTYRPPLGSNGRDSGFIKSALYILETDGKSSISMSGHVGPLEALVYNHESDLRVARQSRDLPRQILYSLHFKYYDNILFHDYRMMWAESTLPVGPNLNLISPSYLPPGEFMTLLYSLSHLQTFEGNRHEVLHDRDQERARQLIKDWVLDHLSPPTQQQQQE